MEHKEFLDQLEDAKIVAAIAGAEAKSSGEIRVFVSRKRPASGAETLRHAQQAFERLGMTRTKHRNGVLLFFAPATRQFAVVGDLGIHEHCGPAFWTDLSQAMQELLKQGNFTSAVLAGVGRAGTALARHFPREPDDRNELPDAVERE